MAAILCSVLILNILLLSSLLSARRLLSIYEMTVNGFFIATISNLSFTAVSLNTKRIEFIETKTVFWILELDPLLFIPCSYIWVLIAIFHHKFHLMQKVVVAIWWLVLMITKVHIYHILGVTQFNNWNLGKSLLEYSIIFLLSITFSIWFRNLLRKEEANQCT